MSWIFYEVLTLQPDFTTPPRAGIEDEREAVPSDGSQFVAWPGRTDRVLTFAWQTMGPEEWRVLREFVDRMSGRAKAFYLPSWRHDFELAADAPATSTVLMVRGHWHSDNVLEGRPDTLGRRLFIYNHLGQFADHWIAGIAAVGENDELTLDRPLTLDLEADRAVIGFLYFARLTSDTVESNHVAPGVAATEITFREISHTRRLNQQESAAGPEIGSLEACEDIIATDDDPIFTEARTVNFAGPFNYGVPQSVNFQSEWTAVLNPFSNELTLTGPSDSFETALYTSPGVAKQVAAAFDASSKEVVAWEIDGQVTIAWLDGVTPESVTFAGYSPVAFNTYAIDATVDAGTATLAVFYLKKWDATIYCRIGAEDFATEHRYCISPLAPLVLHAARRYEGRLELVGMDATHRLARWRSAGYQVPPELQIAAVQLVSMAGAYRSEAVATAYEANAAVGMPIFAGQYRGLTVTADPSEDQNASARLLTISGSYVSVVVPGDPSEDQRATVALATTLPGSYVLTAKTGDPSEDQQASVSLSTITGSYA